MDNISEDAKKEKNKELDKEVNLKEDNIKEDSLKDDSLIEDSKKEKSVKENKIKDKHKKEKTKNNKTTEDDTKENDNYLLIKIFGTFQFILVLADIYVINNYSKNLILNGLLILLTGLITFIFINQIAKKITYYQKIKDEKYELHMKSQMAIYAANKNEFEQLHLMVKTIKDLKETLDSNISSTREELINSNRVIAKTVLKKENDYTEELKFAINSIDLGKSSKDSDNENKLGFDIERIRQDMVNSIGNVSDKCDKIAEVLSEKLNNLVEEQRKIKEQYIEENFNKINSVDVSNMTEEPGTVKVPNVEEISDTVEIPNTEEILDNLEIPNVEEMSDTVEVPNDGEMSDTVEVPNVEEISDTVEIPDIPENVSNEMTMPDISEIPDMGIDEFGMDEEIPDIEIPEVDLSDPNKQLSADEIAALFASMGS